MACPRPLLFAPLLLTLSAPLAHAKAPALADAANDAATSTGIAGHLRAQVLLARAQFSPGEIDGRVGSNEARALRGYQAARGLTVSGKLDADTWTALNADAPAAIVDYVLTAEDVGQPLTKVPDGMLEQGKLKTLGFETLGEALGERFHASPALLRTLNSGIAFDKAGVTLKVPNVADIPALPKAAKAVVDKSDSTLTLLDAAGKAFALFPVSSGSDHDPLPIGEWKIGATVVDPTFLYNPALFWDADKTHAKATIAAGPNNPVGTRWVDLSKPHYGLHGTPTPAAVGKLQSHGCVRLTNWDIERAATALDPSVPVLMQE